MFYVCLYWRDIFLSSTEGAKKSFLNYPPPSPQEVVSLVPCSAIIFHKLDIFSLVFIFNSGEVPSEFMFLADECVWTAFGLIPRLCVPVESLLGLEFEDWFKH